MASKIEQVFVARPLLRRHVIFLPLIAAIFLAVHFWRIRKDRGISGPL